MPYWNSGVCPPAGRPPNPLLAAGILALSAILCKKLTRKQAENRGDTRPATTDNCLAGDYRLPLLCPDSAGRRTPL